jgi:hypothetical protein
VRLFNVHDRRATFAWSAFGAPRTVFILRFDPRFPWLLRHDVFDEAHFRSLDCPRFYFILAPTLSAPKSKAERYVKDARTARDDPSHPAHHGMLAEGGLLNVLARGVSEWRDHWRRDRRTGRPRQSFTFVGYETWKDEWLSPRFRRWRDSLPLLEEEGGGAWWDGAPPVGPALDRFSSGPSSVAADTGHATEGEAPRPREVQDIRARFLRWVLFDTDDWGDEVRGVLRDSVLFMTMDEFAHEVGDHTLVPIITGA